MFNAILFCGVGYNKIYVEFLNEISAIQSMFGQHCVYRRPGALASGRHLHDVAPLLCVNVPTKMRFRLKQLLFPEGRRWKKELF